MIYIFEFKKHWNFPLHSPLCPKFTSVLLPCGNGNSKLSKTGLVCSETLHSLPLAQWDPQRWLCAAPTHRRSSRNWIGYKTVIKKKSKRFKLGKNMKAVIKVRGLNARERQDTSLRWRKKGNKDNRGGTPALSLSIFHVHDKNASLSTASSAQHQGGQGTLSFDSV